jgi:hypothetical protein
MISESPTCGQVRPRTLELGQAASMPQESALRPAVLGYLRYSSTLAGCAHCLATFSMCSRHSHSVQKAPDSRNRPWCRACSDECWTCCERVHKSIHRSSPSAGWPDAIAQACTSRRPPAPSLDSIEPTCACPCLSALVHR